MRGSLLRGLRELNARIGARLRREGKHCQRQRLRRQFQLLCLTSLRPALEYVSIPVRTGSGSRGTDPGGVGQLGNKVGSHVRGQSDTGYRGEPLHSGGSFQPVPFGNQVALNVGRGGPGTGRDVHACGSQGAHGSVAGTSRPQGRDILNNE